MNLASVRSGREHLFGNCSSRGHKRTKVRKRSIAEQAHGTCAGSARPVGQAARGMQLMTYASVLLRDHLRNVMPIPKAKC